MLTAYDCVAFSFQGGWENDETVEEAAVREAIEEAGVRGDLMVSTYIVIIIHDFFSLPFLFALHNSLSFFSTLFPCEIAASNKI